MAQYENFFVREVREKNISDELDILNWYRNLYYQEDPCTERGIMMRAINDYFVKHKEILTGDVVPKSEVERLTKLLDDRCDRCIERERATAAKEIFAEIEALMLDGEIGGKYPAKVINPDKFAELKKKYTEGV